MCARVPQSKRNPQYNEDRLGLELGEYQVRYLRIAGLGGLWAVRPKCPGGSTPCGRMIAFTTTPITPSRINLPRRSANCWISEFVTAMRHHVRGGGMWWRCHRRIIADYLLANGRTVLHLMGGNRIEPAHVTPGSPDSGRQSSLSGLGDSHRPNVCNGPKTDTR